jgi:hypothetical protein
VPASPKYRGVAALRPPALPSAFLTGSNRGNGESRFGIGTLFPPFAPVQILLWLRLAALCLLSFFAANQPKCLSMSMLHKNMAFSIKPQSSPIKVNRVIL